MRIKRLIQHKYSADCSYMKEFLLDTPVTREFFLYLGNFGKIILLPNLGEGFYTFTKHDWFSIKGFAGDIAVGVRFKKETVEITIDYLYLLFSSYREEATDLTALKTKETLRGSVNFSMESKIEKV